MAAEAITPVDELSGLPLPLAPSPNLDPSSEETNWHHHFHPRRSELLKGKAGGIAVRNVRLQLTTIDDHNEYHNHFAGPPLPGTQAERFFVTVLTTAGYVPDSAIDFTGQEPKIVGITDTSREILWQSGQLRHNSSTVVREFFIRYALAQDLSDVRENLVDEFLNTTSPDRRRHLGHWLLGKAIERATEPVDPVYLAAWKSGLLHPKTPANPRTLVKASLGPPKKRESLLDQLEQRLAA
jgi:hypothetical protein